MDSSLSFPAEVDFFSNDNLKSSSSDDDSSNPPPPPPEFKVNTGLTLLTINGDQSSGDDAFAVYSNFKEKAKYGELRTEIAVLQAKLEQIMGENHMLKDALCKVNNDYKALKMHMDLMKPENQVLDKSPEERKHREGNISIIGPRQFIDLGLAYINDGDQANNDEPSLSLFRKRSNGRSKSPVKVEYSAGIGSNDKEFNKEAEVEEEADKFYSPPKNIDDQLEASMRKARVAIRMRSEAPMITDGCQWRKYGQKKAKGNPCPRAYYRCTMTSGCPVKKQVQRCAEDRTILVTTYEGTHSHALPPAALPMAQTTAAAARMLLSGLMSSNDGLMNGSFLTKTTLLPYSSSNMATLSASAPFPTVTLDLTVPPATTTQHPCTQFQTPFSNNNGPHDFTQILAQALSSTNQSSFAGLQTNNNKDPLQLMSAAIAADPNFTAALTAAITSIMGSTLLKNVNGDNNGNVTVGGNRN